MAMVNSKKIQSMIDNFVKAHGRGPTIPEMLKLMRGEKV